MMAPTDLARIDRALDRAAAESDDGVFDELVEFLVDRLDGEDRPLPVHVYRLKYAETLIARHGLINDRTTLRARVVRAMGAGTGERAKLLAWLAALTGRHYDETHRQELVAVADTIAHLALAEAEDGSETQAMVLINLITLYRQSSWQTEAEGDAARAVHFARRAVEATRSGSEFHEVALFNLCTAHLLHAQYSGDHTSLDEGIAATLRLLGTTTPRFRFWQDALLNARQALLGRTQLPMPLKVDWTSAYQALLDRGSAEDELEVEVRVLAAGLLAHSATSTRDLASLDIAIAGLRATDGLLPGGSDFAPLHRRAFRDALTARAALTGDASDLAEATAPDTEPLTGDEAIEVAISLISLGENTGDAGALTDAVETLDRVLRGGGDRLAALNLLCVALRFRSELTRSLDDVSKAITYGEQAAELAATNVDDRATFAVCLLNVGTAYRNRHDLADDLTDLELAIQRLRTSIEVTPTDDGALPIRLSNLGYALMTRHERLRAAADLNEAIDLTDQALRLTPPGTLDYARYAGNLCADLVARAGTEHDDGADLDRAYAAGRAAVKATPPGHPLRGLHLINLSSAIHEDYQRTRAPEQLEEALGYAREAVEESAPGDPRKPFYLFCVRRSLLDRYELAGDGADLREAVTAARQAAELSRPGTRLRAHYDYALAETLARSKDAAELREAAELSAMIAESEASSLSRRLDAANLWGTALQHAKAAPADIFRAYHTGTALLPLLAWRGTGRKALLTKETALATHAAGFALAAGRPEEAVEILELGRDVLWTHLLDLRTDLDTLRETHPDHARRLEALRTAIESPG